MNMQTLQKAPPKKINWIIYAAAMTTVVLWASGFPTTRYSLSELSVEALMLFRFLVASSTMIVIGVIKKVRIPAKKDMPLILVSGFVGIFLYMLLSKMGTAHVPAGVSSFIVNSAPVFILIMATFFLKEKVKPACWAGVGISLIGLISVMLVQTSELEANIGVFYLLLSAIILGIYNIVQRVILKKYTAIESTTYSIVIGTLFMLVYIPAFLREIQHTSLSVNLVVIYSGIFPAAIAYLLWNFALSRVEKTTYVTVFAYLIPFFGSLIAFVWLGETFSPWALVGGIVIVGGMLITNYFGRR